MKKRCSRLFGQKLHFTGKNSKIAFCHTFWETWGLSMASWKAHGPLPISANWTFLNWTFSIFHVWGAMSGYWSKLWCSKGSGLLWAQISGAGDRPPSTVGVRKLESLGYHMMLFACSYVWPFWYNTGVCQTDKQTCRHTTTANTLA